jgi:hypothetical protein
MSRYETPGAGGESPSVVDLVVGSIEAALSLWPEVRDDPALGPEEARDLLALWASVRRFAADAVPGDLAARLDAAVRADAPRLAEQVVRLAPLPSWRRRALRLERSWEYARTDDDIDRREEAAADLFEELDRARLAVYAVRRLVPAGDERRTAVKPLARQVRLCERFVQERPGVFLPVAELAADWLRACRPDLDAFDYRLWETTLTHRAVEEALEEAETPADPVPLDETEKEELLAVGAPAGLVFVLRPWQTAGRVAASSAGGPRPQTKEVSLPGGGRLLASLDRLADGGFVLEFRSASPELRGSAVEVTVFDRQTQAEVLRRRLPLLPDAQGVLTARLELGGLDPSRSYHLRHAVVPPGVGG